MTHTLILARHAEPLRDRRRYTDHSYPLTAVGHTQARSLGAQLHARVGSVDLLYTSDALRALETTQGISTALPIDRIVEEHGIYTGGFDTIRSLITGLGEDLNTVMIVGHEPTISYAVEMLCLDRPELDLGMPTAGSALLSVEGTWLDLAHGLARHEFIYGGDRF